MGFDRDTGEEYLRSISGIGGILADGRTVGDDARRLIPLHPLNDVFQHISESAWLLPTLPCDAGLAVRDPDANPELVADCETLLRVQERFGYPVGLTWNPWWPVTQWTGVTVAGTPQRVTKLNLTRRGLHGELSGLIRDLTALTELRLDFNRLTGIVPSKLQQLTGLTHFSMVANLFTGCLPASLRNVTSDDFGTPNLPDCPPPRTVQSHEELLDGGQTISYQLYTDGLPLVVDLPEGHTYTVEAIIGEPIDRETPSTVVQVVITDAEGYKSWVTFHPITGKELWRLVVGEGFSTPAERRARSDSGAEASPSPLHEVFDRIAESAWLQE